MKLIKYALIVLTVAIMFNFTTVFAARTVPRDGIVRIMTVIKVGATNTELTYTKTDESALRAQSYEIENAATPLTAPCPDCKFKIDLYNADGDSLFGVVRGVSGDYKQFPEKSFINGDYYLKIKRDQWTAVKTDHYGNWYIMANK